jgi:hypothetical protein
MTFDFQETLISLFIGLGLSAACGFRVFTPLLILSAASLAGAVPLAPGFAWVGNGYALVAFAVATLLEVLAYYIPWVDNLLDLLASLAAVLAGVLATASTLGDVSPLLRWSLAIIAGGGLAGMIQAGTVGARGLSTATTGGGGNFLVASGELISAIGLSLVAILWPLLVIILVIVLVLVSLRLLTRSFRRRCRAVSTPGAEP